MDNIIDIVSTMQKLIYKLILIKLELCIILKIFLNFSDFTP